MHLVERGLGVLVGLGFFGGRGPVQALRVRFEHGLDIVVGLLTQRPEVPVT